MTAPESEAITPLVPVEARVIPPIEGANIATTPDGQLRANLRHVVFSLGAGLSGAQQFGRLPAQLFIAEDRMIYTETATFSKLPPDMDLGYAPSADGQHFSIRVSDALSGIAVSLNSADGLVVDE
ncbi:hypothetical protein [Salinibacterium sp. ZJ450]|uniref:hypothetical protein n=1 Tax=Salinibacterium sp. ZJ450 TaxID=2708338 RepID=UPI001424155E|nr:hypothetical protein [Salinibacterium sp. ZJ450]